MLRDVDGADIFSPPPMTLVNLRASLLAAVTVALSLGTRLAKTLER